MIKFFSIIVFFLLLITLSGCATAPIRLSSFPYIHIEINATKEKIFNATVKVINEFDLPIASLDRDAKYVTTEYVETMSTIQKGFGTVLSGITAAQYAHVFELYSTEDLNKNVLVIRILYRWKRLGGGVQYFTETKTMPFYKEAEKIAIKIKEMAEHDK
ncbi:MAG: hypothetical protein HY753_07115 [Nitrospirae bacterium]|nr:hypothetical protein [Nitrospirota bacterium]